MFIPDSLAAELAAWNDRRGISPLSWIATNGSFKHFVGYARLIWPEFIEYENRLYLADEFDAERLQGMLQSGCAAKDAQAFMNAIDLVDMFCDADAYSNKEFRELGEFLRISWAASVYATHPGRQTRVILDDNLDEDGVGELLISLVE